MPKRTRGQWNQLYTAGQISENRKAWVMVKEFEAILFVGVSESAVPRIYDLDAPPMRLEFRFPGRKSSVILNLTAMTVPEIDALKEFLVDSLDKARVICQLLDTRAQEHYDNGEGDFIRLYRPLPQYVDRERGIGQHNPGLPSGPDEPARNLAELADQRRASEGGVGVGGSGAPEHDPQDGSSDDGETASSGVSLTRLPIGILRFPQGLPTADAGEGDPASDQGGDDGSDGYAPGGENS